MKWATSSRHTSMGSVQSTLFHVFSGAYELKTSAVKKNDW